MPRWLKLGLKIFAGVLLLIVLLWLGIALYISKNKASLLKQITAELNEGMNGTLSVESMEPELIRGFPAISVTLKNVLLRDSLYPQHHHDLLKAKDVRVAINAFSVFRRVPEIMNVAINNGSIYLFTDSSGYTNAHIFNRNKVADTSSEKKRPRINHVFLNNIDFTFQNDAKFKLFHLDIHNMESIVNYNAVGWEATFRQEAFVRSFSFNTGRGSYMKDKDLSMNISMSYNRSQEVLNVPEQSIRVGNETIGINGTFNFSKKPTEFVLNIGAKNIIFKNAKALLTSVIADKLNIIDIEKPLEVHANINGSMKFRDTPLVHVTWVVKDNILVTPAGKVKDCSFTGLFYNLVDTAGGHTDDNSKVILYGFKGSYEDIPFTADTVIAFNLIRPVIEGRFHSRFPLQQLNPIIGGNTFAFNSGSVSLDLLYKGGIMADDTTESYIYGPIQVSNASMTYLPRNLSFVNTSALIDFQGTDVFVRNAKVQSGSSVLVMNGSLRRFLNFYYEDPAKIVLDWQIRSSRINLNEFRSFFYRRGAKYAAGPQAAAKPPSGKVTRLSRQLDDVLSYSSVHMLLQVDEVLYKDFTANNINADITMEQSGIALTNISVNNSGGRLVVHGALDQRGTVNNFHVVADIDNVHIQQFFHSFSNFGQDAITDKNLRGNLFAKADVSGSITDNGAIMPGSFNGAIAFDLRDGALVNFEPFIKLSKYVFRNRNLSNVTFKDLKNSLDIKGDKITINPMFIESSAINMKARGVYSLSKGTQIDIDIPLRNPKKDELILDDELKQERAMKGIVLHLQATDGEDGSVKIRLLRKKQDDTTAGPDVDKKKQGKRLLDKLHR
ncbi:MAG: hypothetical protein JWQ38_1631 [Flavipsychrobacter sp.]|nr:hypothetical protein [Flavipsychrobacter sp.]